MGVTPARRQFRLLMTAETLSLFGDQLLGVALPLYVFDHLGGAPASVMILLARVVPQGLLGVWGGAIADRVNRRRLFIGVGLLRALLVLPLFAVAHGGLALAAAVVVGLAASGQLAGPAVGASLPAIVSPADLPSANARLAARTVLVSLVAPTLGALLYAGPGLRTLVVVNVALYLLSSVVARALDLPEQHQESHPGGLVADMADGVRVLFLNPLLRRLLGVVVVAMFGLAVELAVLVPFVRGVLHGSPTSVGALTTVQAIGGLAGAVAVPLIARRLNSRALIHIGVLGLPLAALGFLVSRHVWQAVPGVALAGLLVTMLSAGAQTYLQLTVPRTHIGRVLGVIGSAFGLASMAGTGLAAVLTHVLALRDCLKVAAAIELVAVLIWTLRAGAEAAPRGFVHRRRPRSTAGRRGTDAERALGAGSPAPDGIDLDSLQHYPAYMSNAGPSLEVEIVATRSGPVELARSGTVGKPVVLLLHGTPGSWRQAVPVAEDLAGDFDVLLPSRPGYGRTPVSTGRSVAAQADAYAALLDALALDRAAVVGVSGGGPSALAFAAGHPDRTAALVQCCAVALHLASPPRAMTWLARPRGVAETLTALARRRDRRRLLRPGAVDGMIASDLTADEQQRTGADPRIRE
ncbi:MAG TPA: MFS transporter, partial [Mycobacteriales bacterium]|nr:MFS transporter [Mycobacteriales bacterium]